MKREWRPGDVALVEVGCNANRHFAVFTGARLDRTGVAPMNACPECIQGKHRNCDGRAWDAEADTPTTCECPCGDGAQ